MIYRNCLIPASLIAAGAAVELILRLRLAHLLEDSLYLKLAGHHAVNADITVLAVHLLLRQVPDVKIIFAGIVTDRLEVPHGTAAEFFHDGTAYTAPHAGRHLNEAVAEITLLNILERLYAVIHAVNRHICISRSIAVHGFEYAAGGRKKSGTAVFILCHTLFRHGVFTLKPKRQLLKGQHAVRIAGEALRLILL